MSFESTECQSISGGEYAARLLGVDNPTRLVDHLIEHISAKTGSGHESALPEFKATYHPSPEFPDDSDAAEFEWNVMKSFIALANAQGGCVLIGLEEDNDTHEIKRGDWDPDQILSTCQEDRTRIQRDGQEEKDLINHVRKIFFSDRARRNGKNFRFLERQSGRDPITRDISIDGPSIARLSSLVEIYPCHSETYSCNVLAAVVRPVVKGGELILVQIAGKPETLYYRDSTAQKDDHGKSAMDRGLHHPVPGLVRAIVTACRQEADYGTPWDQFNGDELCLILVNRPSLKEHCDFRKFSGRDWAVLLSENPEFEEICDWSKLDESDWTYLLNDRPWMASRREQHDK